MFLCATTFVSICISTCETGSSATQFRARVRMVFARPLAKAPAQPIDVDGAVEVSVSASSGQAASVVPSASRRKRPRRNARARQTLCAGLPELPCRYAADGSGAPAQGKHAGRCIFCSSAAMARVIDTPQGRGNVEAHRAQYFRGCSLRKYLGFGS